MAVTLFDSGLVITDEQATRLDDYAVAVWYPEYVEANGAPPTGWPAASAHEILAEWVITRLAATAVRAWEKRQAIAAVTVDEW